MSHPIFTTSQSFTPLHFDSVHSDLAAHCVVTERADGRAPQSLRGARDTGTLLPFLSLLLNIAVSADVGHAS